MPRKLNYTVDHTVFDVLDTDEKCYWLGYIAATLYVSSPDSARQKLEAMLGLRHWDHLEKLANFLKYTPGPVRAHKMVKGKVYTFASIDVRNKHLVHRLQQLGAHRKRRQSTWPAEVPDEHAGAYVRGYADGSAGFNRNLFAITCSRALIDEVCARSGARWTLQSDARFDGAVEGTYTFRDPEDLQRLGRWLYGPGDVDVVCLDHQRAEAERILFEDARRAVTEAAERGLVPLNDMRDAWRYLRTLDDRLPNSAQTRCARVDPRWMDDFDAFLADVGRQPAGTTLTRVDLDGDFVKGNCRWTPRGQAERVSMRTPLVRRSDGEVHTLTYWSAALGLSYSKLIKWWNRGIRGDALLHAAEMTPDERAAAADPNAPVYVHPWEAYTHNGRTQSLNAWADELGINRALVHQRWVNGRRGDRLLAKEAPLPQPTPRFAKDENVYTPPEDGPFTKRPPVEWRTLNGVAVGTVRGAAGEVLGRFAVDEADLPAVRDFRWTLDVDGRPRAAAEVNGVGCGAVVSVATLLKGTVAAGWRAVVDHVNGDPRDNRRVNLRLCTHAQNIVNSRSRLLPDDVGPDNPPGGVTFSKRRGTWAVAWVLSDRRHVQVGTYAAFEDALAAWRRTARLLYGRFDANGPARARAVMPDWLRAALDEG